jgi:hypothetical protein
LQELAEQVAQSTKTLAAKAQVNIEVGGLLAQLEPREYFDDDAGFDRVEGDEQAGERFLARHFGEADADTERRAEAGVYDFVVPIPGKLNFVIRDTQRKGNGMGLAPIQPENPSTTVTVLLMNGKKALFGFETAIRRSVHAVKRCVCFESDYGYGYGYDDVEEMEASWNRCQCDDLNTEGAAFPQYRYTVPLTDWAADFTCKVPSFLIGTGLLCESTSNLNLAPKEMKVADLCKELNRRGLDTSVVNSCATGVFASIIQNTTGKAVLVKRLEEYIANSTSAQPRNSTDEMDTSQSYSFRLQSSTDVLASDVPVLPIQATTAPAASPIAQAFVLLARERQHCHISPDNNSK